jgi:hypothetical protein
VPPTAGSGGAPAAGSGGAGGMGGAGAGAGGAGGSPAAGSGGAGGSSSPECAQFGQACAVDGDCCSGLPCFEGTCTYNLQ